MKSRLTCMLVMALAVGWLSTSLNAEPIGFIMWSVNIPGTAGEFDIANQTGPANSSVFPDTTWPVSTSVSLSSLSLTVHFSDASTTVFGPAYFTLEADGLSYAGGAIAIGGANPLPVDATLTGTFSPLLITLNDGSTETISPTFSATIVTSGSPGDPLGDGDFAIILARSGGGPPPVPEPSSWLLLGTAVVGLLIFQNRHLRSRFSVLCSAVKGPSVLRMALFLCGLMVLQSASWAAVNLNFNTSPGSGVAGVSQVWAVGSNFPAGVITPANVNVTLATTCGGAPVATTTALAVQTVIGTSRKVKFLVPASLATGLYYVKISDTVDAAAFTSANCSQIQVTHTSTTLSGCAPASSLGIYSPASGPAEVSALVPNGAWSGGTTGVKIAQLETGGGPVIGPASFPTAATVNSCAVNPATGEGVCTANTNAVYTFNTSGRVATGTFLSGSDVSAGFSGGSCRNCGVAVDALNNMAQIAMGHSGGLSGTALQPFYLATHTFGPATQLFHEVSEDIVINPLTSQILSASEAANFFDIIPYTPSTGVPTGQFGKLVSHSGVLDSTAVDCSTGIIAAPYEFTSSIVLADSTQATFTAGAPGTWVGPSSFFDFTGASFSAGASALVIAPGSSHLGIVTGEFGGSSFAVILLPSVSGAPNPAPTVVDWAYVSCITGTSAGLDPHTVSAYTSPNNGNAYGVFASGGPPPTSLKVVDLAGILARPRNAGTHTVTGDPGAGGCIVPAPGTVITSIPL